MNTICTYRNAPVGQQLLAHFEGRAVLRRSVPLFPSPWAAWLAPFRKESTQQPAAGRHSARLASQPK